MVRSIFLFLFLLSNYCFSFQSKTITFEAKDGLKVTADLYESNKAGSPFIILFHQAGWSRGEYREIAPKLNDLGFNCLAVDQRSGNTVNGVDNETSKTASSEGLETGMINAIPDLEAAISYVKSNYKPSVLIIWGSSYSASLVLKVAGDNPGLVDGVLSFSPGEYFGKDISIANSAGNIQIPVFITSAKGEKKNWERIFESIPSEQKTNYLPETTGNHGSRALWKKFSDSKGYWDSVIAFLDQFRK